MAHFLEHSFNLLFIAKPSVVRANRDLHKPNFGVGVQGVQGVRGVQEFRSSGVQEFRSSGVQEFEVARIAKLQAAKRLWFENLRSTQSRPMQAPELLNSCNS